MLLVSRLALARGGFLRQQNARRSRKTNDEHWSVIATGGVYALARFMPILLIPSLMLAVIVRLIGTIVQVMIVPTSGIARPIATFVEVITVPMPG